MLGSLSYTRVAAIRCTRRPRGPQADQSRFRPCRYLRDHTPRTICAIPGRERQRQSWCHAGEVGARRSRHRECESRCFVKCRWFGPTQLSNLFRPARIAAIRAVKPAGCSLHLGNAVLPTRRVRALFGSGSWSSQTKRVAEAGPSALAVRTKTERLPDWEKLRDPRASQALRSQSNVGGRPAVVGWAKHRVLTPVQLAPYASGFAVVIFLTITPDAGTRHPKDAISK